MNKHFWEIIFRFLVESMYLKYNQTTMIISNICFNKNSRGLRVGTPFSGVNVNFTRKSIKKYNIHIKHNHLHLIPYNTAPKYNTVRDALKASEPTKKNVIQTGSHTFTNLFSRSPPCGGNLGGMWGISKLFTELIILVRACAESWPFYFIYFPSSLGTFAAS